MIDGASEGEEISAMLRQCPHCGAQLPATADANCPQCQGALGSASEATGEIAETFPSEIEGLEGLTNEEVQWELQRGARFVVYQYCISFVVLTWYRSSQVHFIRSNESAVLRGMKYTFLSLALGWWGIPFGPIGTIAAVITNLCGGHNITPTAGLLDALKQT